jgi:hypothetical protein
MTEVDAAVRLVRDMLGDRVGSEESVRAFVASQDTSLCHFCGEHMAGIFIDFMDDFKGNTSLTSLCCKSCWDLRRSMPYHIVKEECKFLKSGAKKFCGGEWHDSLEHRVLYKSQFDTGFDICKTCMHENVRKRRIPYEEYVKSWTDEHSWQNRMASFPLQKLRDERREKLRSTQAS